MWLMTTRGFFSIVAHNARPDTFLVRSRHRADLENVAAFLGDGGEIVEGVGSDYPFRRFVSGAQKDALLAALGSEIDYPNFKSEIARHPGQRGKVGAYHDVWAVLRRTQRGGENQSSRELNPAFTRT